MKIIRFGSIYLMVLLSLVISRDIFAQDTHYWTIQYGSRTALLGGAVVAGVQDNAMVLYNPGAIGFIENNSLSVNANVYQLENIKIKNALGDQTEFKSNQFTAIPILISGMFNLKHDNWKLGYSLVSPVQFNFRADARIDNEFDVINEVESPGQEEFIAESEKKDKLSELTGALGLSRRINDTWSVGVTQLVTLRSLFYRNDLFVHAFMNNEMQTPVSTTLYSETSYYHVRYQAKFGATYTRGPWRLGATFTTPSIRLFGNGWVAADLTTTNLSVEDERQDIVASDRQKKLPTTFKAPMSVAFGGIYDDGQKLFALTAEYWTSIGEYAVLQPEPSEFFRGSAATLVGSEEFLKVSTGARSVFNVAVAFETELKQHMRLHTSFRTDFSYRLPYDYSYRRIVPEITSWDIYHITGGLSFEREKSVLSIGVLLGFGRSDRHREQGNLDNITEAEFVKGNAVAINANYSSIGILLGYRFDFKRQ